MNPRRICLPLAVLAAGLLWGDAPTLRLDRIIGDHRDKIEESLSVAVTDDGRLFILMQDGRVAVFAADGAYLHSRRLTLRYPPRPYHLQSRGNRVFLGHLDDDYPWLTELPRRGEAPGRFQRPQAAITAPDGRIYVADTGNRRIQIFTPDETAQPEAMIELAGPPAALDVRHGRLAVVTDRALLIFTPDAAGWRVLAEAPAPADTVAVAFGPDLRDLYLLISGNRGGHRLEHWRHDADALALDRLVAPNYLDAWPDFFRASGPLTAGPDGAVWWVGAGSLLRWAPGDEHVTEVRRNLPHNPQAVGFRGAEAILIGTHRNIIELPLATVETAEPRLYLGPERLDAEGGNPRVWGLLPDPDEGVVARQIEAGWRRGWPALVIKRLHPQEDPKKLLDFGGLFAVRRRFAPWEMRLGLAWLPDGNIAFTALPLQAVYKVTPTGDILWEAGRLPQGGAAEVELEGPADLTVDRRGRIWVTDADDPAIFCFAPDGRLLLRHGTEGDVDQRDGLGFGRPTGIAAVSNAAGDWLVVGDARARRLLVYRLD